MTCRRDGVRANLRRRIAMRYILAFILALLLSITISAQAQVGINVNLGVQPAWGPTGHDYVEYYYLPDIEAYYHVPQRRFYVYEGGNWIYRSSLPTRYRNHDLYRSYKVVVNQPQPWLNHPTFRTKYSSYKGRKGQPFIRDSKDSKYFVNVNHPKHASWKKEKSAAGKNSSYRDKGGVKDKNYNAGKQSSRKNMSGQQQSNKNKGNKPGKGNK
jgi:hypothetical protein